jgi:hypothetical protein
MIEDVREDTAKELLSRQREPGVQQAYSAQWNGVDMNEPVQNTLQRLLAKSSLVQDSPLAGGTMRCTPAALRSGSPSAISLHRWVAVFFSLVCWIHW